MSTAVGHYGRILLRRWRWVVWGVLVALLATSVTLAVSPPLYRSDAMVFVRTPGDVSRAQDGGDSYARARAATYAALAKSSSLSSAVIANLGLNVDGQTLSRRIAAHNPGGTALISIAVSAPSSAEAQHTATVLLSELAEMVRTLETVPGSLVPRAELVIVDPPRPPLRLMAWGLPVPVVLFGATLVGLVLGALAAVIGSMASRPQENGDLAPVATPVVVDRPSMDGDDIAVPAASSAASEARPHPAEVDVETAPLVVATSVAAHDEVAAAASRLASGRHRPSDDPPTKVVRRKRRAARLSNKSEGDTWS